ncbi:hypothetical protein [Nonomuraea sp. NPDC049784]|uniref:hypothetical protein n=1 Tax=Nonomuraea sp. NPDC049784 TaxID=3154361 RepID=UPI0033F93747
MSVSLHLRPAGNHDLRGHHLPELRYPHNSVLVVAGVSVKDIAQDSGLKVTTIDEWIAMDYLRRTPTMISRAKRCPS